MGKSKKRGRSKPSDQSSIHKVIQQQMRSALRKIWSIYSPERANVLHRAKRTGKRYNKDGSVSKVPMVTFICAECGEGKPQTEVQVDHILGVGKTPDFPPKRATNGLTQEEWLETWDAWLLKVHTDEENQQALCKDCHKVKTREERALLRKGS